MDSPRRPAVYEDLLAYPEGTHTEILDGDVFVFPSPSIRHQYVLGALNQFIGAPFDTDHGRGGPGGYVILPRIDLRLESHQVVCPDISGWRRHRFPDKAWDTRPIDVVPDWVCEIVEPEYAAHDRVKKKGLYRQYRVPFYWIVDPEARMLEAFRLQGETWQDAGAYDEDSVARIAPFEAVELEVGRLFPPRVRVQE